MFGEEKLKSVGDISKVHFVYMYMYSVYTAASYIIANYCSLEI